MPRKALFKRRSRARKRRSVTAKKGAPGAKLPRDVKTTTPKAELAKRAKAERPSGLFARDTSAAANFITQPAEAASHQLDFLHRAKLDAAQAAEKELPRGPVPVIEKKLSNSVIDDWHAALPTNHPAKAFSGSVRLNPQVSFRAGTHPRLGF